MRLIDADALRASAMQATETNEVSFNNCFSVLAVFQVH